jgi:cytochrome c oxidase cbb3-type subunit 3
MFARNLETIAGIGIYPLISLLIFFGFFSVLILYLVKADKQAMDRSSQIPLQINETSETSDQL